MTEALIVSGLLVFAGGLCMYHFLYDSNPDPVQSNPTRLRDETISVPRDINEERQRAEIASAKARLGVLVKQTRARRAARNKIIDDTILCPLCRDKLGYGIRCRSCGTAFHGACVVEIAGGKCPTFGCKSYL